MTVTYRAGVWHIDGWSAHRHLGELIVQKLASAQRKQ
jgi:hypothetical protein